MRANLTTEEVLMLDGVAAGMSDADMATHLFPSRYNSNEVSKRVTRLRSTFGFENRVQLAVWWATGGRAMNLKDGRLPTKESLLASVRLTLPGTSVDQILSKRWNAEKTS